MSIVALKRKTFAQYKNNSVGEAQFSLVGTHRSQGYIGQSTQSRFFVRTLKRGNTARGHGGCCGVYPEFDIIPTEICTTEDPTVVKSSCDGNLGMLLSRFRWARRPQPYSSTKTVVSNGLAQSDYTDRIKKESLLDTTTCNTRYANGSIKLNKHSNGVTYSGRWISGCPDTNPSTATKPQYLSQGDYIEQVTQNNNIYDKVQSSGPTNGAPNLCGNSLYE
jgi:hypothetical protein